MFKAKLYNISEDLQSHHRDKDVVYSECVSQRLDKALQSYINSLDSSLYYLSCRKEINVLKKLN